MVHTTGEQAYWAGLGPEDVEEAHICKERRALKEEITKRCAQLGVLPCDCWLGGPHEEFIEQFDNDTISVQELARVLSEGEWDDPEIGDCMTPVKREEKQK